MKAERLDIAKPERVVVRPARNVLELDLGPAIATRADADQPDLGSLGQVLGRLYATDVDRPQRPVGVNVHHEQALVRAQGHRIAGVDRPARRGATRTVERGGQDEGPEPAASHRGT
ncbi:MAG TPA: hypothetical protein VKH41_05490 [Myxococcota bacterium]|nr:hypothetical protein [Myxococcota bacterium]